MPGEAGGGRTHFANVWWLAQAGSASVFTSQLEEAGATWQPAGLRGAPELGSSDLNLNVATH